MATRQYYDQFEYPREEEDDGLPRETVSGAEALGNVVIGFADLEEQLAVGVSFLIGRTDLIGSIVTSELSFKLKLHIFSSLFRAARPNSENHAQMEDLIAAFGEAEQIRNPMIHSSWWQDFETIQMTRRKRSAKMSRGYRTDEEQLTPWQIQSFAHHLGYLGFIIDELLYIEFGEVYGSP